MTMAAKRKAKRATKRRSGTTSVPARARRKPTGYARVLADLKERIAESRRRALMTVNRELMLLYWHIGSVSVRQQEGAKWGDAVVEQLAADLRAEFPEMKGLAKDNLFRMRKFILSCHEQPEKCLPAEAHSDDAMEYPTPPETERMRVTPDQFVILSATPPEDCGEIVAADAADRSHPVLGRRVGEAKPTRLFVAEKAKGLSAAE